MTIHFQMKTKILLIAALVIGSMACKRSSKTNPGGSLTDTIPQTVGDIYSSVIRPGENLQLGEIYTDHFEYTGYNDDGDYFFLIVRKDGEKITLLDGLPGKTFPVLNRGDMVDIQWKIDSVWIAGDNEVLDFTEWAVGVRKTGDGKVSLFKQKRSQPLKYYYDGELAFNDSFLHKIYQEVEYYLANSKQELVKKLVNDPTSDLAYSIEERKQGGKSYYVIGIANDFENHSSIVQWIYLTDDLQQIFEYDLQNNELIEFK